MNFPTDPWTRDGLWLSFEKKLRSSPVCIVVQSRRLVWPASYRVLLPKEAEDMLCRFKEAAICRMGCNHGEAILPYVAFHLEGEKAVVSEFLAATSTKEGTVSEDDIKSDLKSIATSIFFHDKFVGELAMPGSIAGEGQIVLRRDAPPHRAK